MRFHIFLNFEQHKTIEKRVQRYLLMADDSGIQSAFYLLLLLSEMEVFSITECNPEIMSSLSSGAQSPPIDKFQSVLS